MGSVHFLCRKTQWSILPICICIFILFLPYGIQADDSNMILPDSNAALETLWAQEKQLLQNAAEQADDRAIRQQVAAIRTRISIHLFRENRFNEALFYLDNALELVPDHALRWDFFGDICNFMGHPASDFFVQYAYEKALELDPSIQSTRKKLAGSYLSSERFLKAIEQFEQVILAEKDGHEWETIALLASAYAFAGEIPRGINFFEKMFLYNEDNQFRLAAAILEHASGKDDSSFKLLEIIKQQEPADSALESYAERLLVKYARASKQQ